MKLKGQTVSGLQGSALAIVVLVITVAIGATVLSEVRDTQTAAATDYNVTSAGLDALGTYGDWFEIIVIVIIAVVIIGLLVRSFARAGA